MTSQHPPSEASGYVMVSERGTVTMKPHAEARHGSPGDERYPSPRMLRRGLAFLADVVIHLGVGIGAGVMAGFGLSTAAVRVGDWQHTGVDFVVAAAAWPAASIVDRVVLQSFTHTTVGKAIFGLVALRRDTGEYPAFGRLLGMWLFGIIFLPLVIIGNGIGPDHPVRYFLTAVRRRDRRQYPALAEIQ